MATLFCQGQRTHSTQTNNSVHFVLPETHSAWTNMVGLDLAASYTLSRTHPQIICVTTTINVFIYHLTRSRTAFTGVVHFFSLSISSAFDVMIFNKKDLPQQF